MKKEVRIYLILSSLMFGLPVFSGHIKNTQRHAKAKADKKAAQHVADYVVSPEFITDIHTLLQRSADPVKEYVRNYFFHCDFHKDQLQSMKHCFAEFNVLMEESMPICVHALFSYLVSDAMKEHVQSTAQSALQVRGMAIYAAPGIMEYIEEQEGILSREEREQFVRLKKSWSEWYARWSDFLIQLGVYVEARTELRESFLESHKRSFWLSLVWKHIGPGLWFLVSHFRIAYIMLGNSVHDANYFLIQLMLRLHKNVMVQRSALEKKIIARAQESWDLYSGIINQVIDENIARF